MTIDISKIEFIENGDSYGAETLNKPTNSLIEYLNEFGLIDKATNALVEGALNDATFMTPKKTKHALDYFIKVGTLDNINATNSKPDNVGLLWTGGLIKTYIESQIPEIPEIPEVGTLDNINATGGKLDNIGLIWTGSLLKSYVESFIPNKALEENIVDTHVKQSTFTGAAIYNKILELVTPLKNDVATLKTTNGIYFGQRAFASNALNDGETVDGTGCWAYWDDTSSQWLTEYNNTQIDDGI